MSIKRIFFVLALATIFTKPLWSQVSFEWGKEIGDNRAHVTLVKVSKSGIIYSGGQFSGTADLDSGPGTCTVSAGGNSVNVFVTSFDNSGNFRFGFAIAGPDFVHIHNIDSDNNDNLIVVGIFRDKVDFDPGPGTTLMDGGMGETFVCKYDKQGVLLWCHKFAFAGASILVDSDDSYFMYGQFTDSTHLNPNSSTTQVKSKGKRDIFLSKFTSGGQLLWNKTWGTPADELLSSIVVHSNKSISLYITFSDSIRLDTSPQGLITNFSKQSNFAIAHLDQFLNVQWKQNIGMSDNSGSAGIMALDSYENIYFTGHFMNDTIDLDLGPQQVVVGGYDLTFISKLDKNGNFLWAKQWNHSLFTICELKVRYDDIYIGGTCYFADFDPGPDTSLTVPRRAFLCVLSRDGLFLNVSKVHGAGAMDFDLDKSTGIYFVSHYSVKADIDPGVDSFLIVKNTGFSYITKWKDLSTNNLSKINKQVSELKVFPNPTDESVRIDNPFTDSDPILRVTDVLGRPVQAKQTQIDGEIEIDLEGQPVGIYFIKLIRNEKEFTARVVKN